MKTTGTKHKIKLSKTTGTPMPKTSKKVEKKVRKIKAWAHIKVMTGIPYEVFVQKERPACPVGAVPGTKCIIPCTITYSFKKK